MNRSAQAFTLTELLVVVGIMALLVGTMMPSFVTVKDLANETRCQNQLNLISKAIQGYYSRCDDELPMNDIQTVTYHNIDANDMLPGDKSTPRWWCNKVYKYGIKRSDIYRCPSDPDRGLAGEVHCGYGFNDTLTKDDKVVTPYEIKDPPNTALVGHCSWITEEPAIIEAMVTPSDWPRGHMRRYDQIAKEKQGRCGFIMADGHVRTRTYSEVISKKNANGKLELFHK
jgi:type II secretory pathway pseudopilin PulG